MASRGLSEVLSDFSAPSAVEPRKPAGAFSLLDNRAETKSPTQFVHWPVASSVDVADPSPEPAPQFLDVDDGETPVFTVDDTDSDDALQLAGGADERPVELMDQEIAQLREAHAVELAMARDEAADRELDALSGRLTGLEDALLTRLETGVAEVLANVFGNKIADESLVMLCKWLKARLVQHGLMQVEITGPKQLTDKLKQLIGDETDHYRVVESDAIDIQVEIDGEVLSTRLGEWRRMVEDCLR